MKSYYKHSRSPLVTPHAYWVGYETGRFGDKKEPRHNVLPPAGRGTVAQGGKQGMGGGSTMGGGVETCMDQKRAQASTMEASYNKIQQG